MVGGHLTDRKAVDKQKILLEKDSGHFSMIKMLHLADLITELNGTYLFFRSSPRHVSYAGAGKELTMVPRRILRCHVYLQLDALLSG